jgi:excisionase family DNA binding protein
LPEAADAAVATRPADYENLLRNTWRIPVDGGLLKLYFCNMANAQKQILNVKAAAEVLGCTRQNVMYLLARGKLAGWQVNGRCWVVERASLEKLAAERAA